MRHAELRQSLSHAGRLQQPTRAIGLGAVSEPARCSVVLSSGRAVARCGRERDAPSCLQEVADELLARRLLLRRWELLGARPFERCASVRCVRRSASSRAGFFGSRGAAAYVDGAFVFGRRRALRREDLETSVSGESFHGVWQRLFEAVLAFTRW